MLQSLVGMLQQNPRFVDRLPYKLVSSLVVNDNETTEAWVYILAPTSSASLIGYYFTYNEWLLNNWLIIMIG